MPILVLNYELFLRQIIFYALYTYIILNKKYYFYKFKHISLFLKGSAIIIQQSLKKNNNNENVYSADLGRALERIDLERLELRREKL